jgi:hypothetical protein
MVDIGRKKIIDGWIGNKRGGARMGRILSEGIRKRVIGWTVVQ